MRSKAIAAVLTTALAFSPLMAACGNASSGSASNSADTASSASTASESATTSALDGAWRQVGIADGADGIIGAIDGDSIALWMMNGGHKWKYWYGTFEAPKDNAAYTWKSKAYKTNKDGRFTADDEVVEFSYSDGKISFA
ncbi:MAG: hypothetical protein Q4B54_10745, partial [Coriobacteriales bacterium]|nr:hypothetical protein [Coriobacteriales bacterium]